MTKNPDLPNDLDTPMWATYDEDLHSYQEDISISTEVVVQAGVHTYGQTYWMIIKADLYIQTAQSTRIV